jgi:hypothetical protein
MSLEVFVDRLPRIKSEVRTTNAVTIGKIIKQTARHLVQSSTTILTTTALSALHAVISTAMPKEDSAIASIVNQMIEVVAKVGDVFNLEATLSLLDLTM